MAEFGFSEDHEILRKAAKDFAIKALAPGAKERAIASRIPDWMIKKIGELGYIGMTADEKYGGLGMDMISVGIVVEEFGKVDVGAAHTVLIPTEFCSLLESGSGEHSRGYQR